MARPPITKRVCKEPEFSGFKPIRNDRKIKTICLSVDEYETIRLIDLEGISREECAKRMNIARTTAQAIYNRARVKIAECIVHGKGLKIEGGIFDMCDGTAGCEDCSRPVK